MEEFRRLLLEAPTLSAAHAAMRRWLHAVKIEGAARDARLLVCGISGIDQAALIAHGDRQTEMELRARMADAALCRCAGEPVSRILGRRAFYGLEFEVTPDVLDPRPETETLIEAVLDLFPGREVEPINVLDLGTGSGALLVTLLHLFPAARGTGVDISPTALEVAGRNATVQGVGDRAEFVCGNWWDYNGARPKGGFNIVVSNPPYIASGDIAGLDVGVRNYDPHLALDGGGDGLDAYRAIVAGVRAELAIGGCLLVEVGAGQAPEVAALMRDAGLLAPQGRRTCTASGLGASVRKKSGHPVESRRRSAVQTAQSRQPDDQAGGDSGAMVDACSRIWFDIDGRARVVGAQRLA